MVCKNSRQAQFFFAFYSYPIVRPFCDFDIDFAFLISAVQLENIG